MEKYFLAALLMVRGIGNQKVHDLLRYFDSAEEIWKADIKEFSKLRFSEATIDSFVTARAQKRPWRLAETCQKQGIEVLDFRDKEYPYILKQIVNYPLILYTKGQKLIFDNTLGIVGSRTAGNYGKAVVDYFIKGLSAYNFITISGGARGIDSQVHESSLKYGLPTVAVMGCGLDVVYPKENKELFESICTTGMLISEYPPGAPPVGANFPRRNRIISGLARGVVVVEAAVKSGSLITAEFAMDNGREVYCVPGNIFDVSSQGVHRLIKQGAKLTDCVADIIEDFNVTVKNTTDNDTSLSELTSLAKAEFKAKRVSAAMDINRVKYEQQAITGVNDLLSCLSDEPLSVEELIELTALSPTEISCKLLELELSGKVHVDSARKYTKVKGVL